MGGNSELVLVHKYPLQNSILSPNSVPHKFVPVEWVAMLGSRALIMPAVVCLDSASDTSRRPWQERESPVHSLRGRAGENVKSNKNFLEISCSLRFP